MHTGEEREEGEGRRRTYPAPSGVLVDRRRDVRADEGIDDERCGSEAVKPAPLERRDVRDDDGRQKLQASAARQRGHRDGVCKGIEDVRVAAVDRGQQSAYRG